MKNLEGILLIMAVEIQKVKDKLIVSDASNVGSLQRSFIGSPLDKDKSKLELNAFETLYLMDVRGAKCISNEATLSFNDVAAPFKDEPKFLARYFCYRDWRDRGLVIRSEFNSKEVHGQSPTVTYPSVDFHSLKVENKATYFPDDLMAIIDNNDEGEHLYGEYWFGQYGTYKSKKHGRLLKLDAYETVFLAEHAKMHLDVSLAKVKKEAKTRRQDFDSLYAVYEDLRLRGFVLKTGFKFGTHFRLYFPGAKPSLTNDEWMHSKHVIHVFPRDLKLIISEWARAIRVAHSVRKTFILAIPGKKRESKAQLDFILYHRTGAQIDTPKTSKPKFVMLALSEEEEISGQDLAQAIAAARKMGLQLVLSICDRETSVTHYKVTRIELEKSAYEYYEVEWLVP